MESKPLEKSFASQVFSFGTVQIVLRLRGLITLPILSRLLGTTGYGLLGALLTLCGFIPILILLGANTALTVFIPGGNTGQRRRDFWGVVQVTVITSFVVTLILALGYPWVKNALLPTNVTFELYLLGILIVPVSSLQLVFYAQIINNQQGKEYARAVTVGTVLDLIGLISGAYLLGLRGVLISSVVTQFILLVWTLTIVRSEDPFVPLSLSHMTELRKYYAYGLTMFIAGFGAWVIDSSDRFIIGRFLHADDLGVYQAAYNLCSQLSQFSGPLFATLMPFVVGSIKAGDTSQARRYLEQTYKLLLMLFVPAVILLSLTRNDVIASLTTQAFARGAETIPFVACGIALYQIVGIYTYNLHAHQRGYLLIITTGCGAIVNLVLNLIFVPLYGIIAAAISTLVAYIIVFGLDWYFSNQSLKIGLSTTFLIKIAIASMAMTMIAILTQNMLGSLMPLIRLLLTVAAGGGGFLAATVLLQLFTLEEQIYLLSAAKAFLTPSGRK